MRIFTLLFSLLLLNATYAQETFPIDFESGDFTFNNFGGSSSEIIDNPFSGGINTSAKVLKLTKGSSETWAGTGIIRTTMVDFSAAPKVTMKVYSNRAGAKIKFKIENNPDYNNNVLREVETTKAGEWEELTFDFVGETKTDLSTIVFFMDDGTLGEDTDDWTYYIDDINFSSSDNVLPEIPVDFESSTILYNFENFGGADVSIVDNPFSASKNGSSKVVKFTKTDGAETWAGTALKLGKYIDFSENTKVYISVYSPAAGVPVLLKLEGDVDPTEISVSTTTANQWEVLEWDFSGTQSGVYNKVVLFMNFGNVGTGADYYFDDISREDSGNLFEKDQTLADKINIYSSGNSLFIANLQELKNGSVKLFDISGRLISDKNINADRMSINSLNTGFYVIVVSDNASNMILSQKVIIQ